MSRLVRHCGGGLEKLSSELSEPIEVFAYPYGSYNDDTLSILRRRGCRLAFTTKVNVILDPARPLEVPRVDTNDVPLTADEETKSPRA